MQQYGIAGINIYELIIGNILGLLCNMFCALSSFGKTKKKIMFMQCLDCTCGTLSDLALHGYSGALTQFINLVRNFLVYKGKETNTIKFIIMAITIIAGFAVNNMGILGLLPIIASIQYSLTILYTNNPNYIRIGLAVNNLFWLGYSIITLNYVSCIMTIIIIVSCIISVIKNRKQTEGTETIIQETHG